MPTYIDVPSMSLEALDHNATIYVVQIQALMNI